MNIWFVCDGEFCEGYNIMAVHSTLGSARRHLRKIAKSEAARGHKNDWEGKDMVWFSSCDYANIECYVVQGS